MSKIISIFPNPHEDELLYSVIARYHLISGNRYRSNSFKDLFDVNMKTGLVDFPNNLHVLDKKTHIFKIKEHVSEWVYFHTSFNYYTFFLEYDMHQKILNDMVYTKNKNNISLTVGKAASRVKEHTYLRFCPECFEEENEKYGYAFWHVHHQLPGVYYCAIHNVKTFDSNIAKNSKDLVLPNKNNIIVNNIEEPNNEQENEQEKRLMEISFLSKEISQSVNEIHFNSNIIYRNILKLLNYGKYNNKVSSKAVLRDIVDFLGEDTISKLDIEIAKLKNNLNDLWLTKHVRKHPLFHILLIIFLYNKLELNIFETDIETLLRRGIEVNNVIELDRKNIKNHLVCLNHHCKSYKKNVNSQISTNVYNQILTTRYKCLVCGFTYLIRGSDFNKQNYIWDLVLECGHLLEEKILYLFNIEKMKIYSIAKILGIPEGCVSSTVNNEIKNVQEDRQVKGVRVYNKELDRKKWLELMKNNPHSTKTELRKMEYALFKRLYYNDKEWLYALNYPKKERTFKEIVDWLKRDDEYLQLVIEAHRRLLTHKPLVRVTLNSIVKEANIKWDAKYIEKLPKTYCYMKSNAEEWDEYYLRRADLLLDEQRLLPFEKRLKRKVLTHKVGYYIARKSETKEKLKAMMDDYFTCN